MLDDNAIELILTADGNTKNIVFFEELVESAPEIEGLKFTALKPVLEINGVCISMAGYEFDNKNIHFFKIKLPRF
jgi:hypothetical protein